MVIPITIVALAFPWAAACSSEPDVSPSHEGETGGSAGQLSAPSSEKDAMVGSANGGGGVRDDAAGQAGKDTAPDAGSTADSADAASPEGMVGDATGTTAVGVEDFLDSIGVCNHMGIGTDPPTPNIATSLAYLGVRNVREDANLSLSSNWIALHNDTGVRFCLVTNNNLADTIDEAKQLNDASALLAVEGPNEPNNWPIAYMGQTSSKTTSMAVALFQRDLYAAVKGDPGLSKIPVFHSSEAGGAEPDNVGLQFLTIPADAGTLMPGGTKYADYANIHDYLYRQNRQAVDNLAWKAYDPTLNAAWSGLYVEFGHTWKGGFAGYSNSDLPKVPRVITETGWTTGAPLEISPEQEGRLYVSLYLSAFKQGFTHTFIYMLRNEPQAGAWAMLGMFDENYQPKKEATYLHNLTTILADTGTRTLGKLNYSIANEPATVHDLLLQKKNGTFELIVWDERPSGGSDHVVVDLGAARTTVKIYDPITGTAPTDTLHDATSVPLTLTDHPVIIEL